MLAAGCKRPWIVTHVFVIAHFLLPATRHFGENFLTMTRRLGREKKKSKTRRENLRKLIRDSYEDEWLPLRREIAKKCGEKFARRVKAAHSGYQNFTGDMAAELEVSLNIETGFFSQESPPKSPAYILIQCDGNSVQKLFDQIRNIDIVDEVAIIVGDADLFVRLFGTQEQFKEFLTKTIYSWDCDIHRTNTHFSFEDSYFQRPIPKKASK